MGRNGPGRAESLGRNATQQIKEEQEYYKEKYDD